MKTKLRLASVFLMLSGIFIFSTSFSDSSTENWEYVPVFMKRADLEQSVSYQSTVREMENPGKI
ncbi:hypothetical protein FACS189440_16810 [Bacteroidia bacterium]|nr:hypothetical protein FACS189440_16810 [Bacteroidia bacterium]